MKIVHVITGLNNGGAEAVLFRLCINDQINQHVVISLMGMGKYGALLSEKGIEVHCLNMHRGRVSFSGLHRLYGLCKSIKPDVLQTWMYHADLIGGLIAKLAGIKKIFWSVHHTSLKTEESKKSTIYTANLCALLSHLVPKKIIFCANKAAEVHGKLGYKKRKIRVISNGYELNRFCINEESGTKIKNEFLLHDTAYVLGMVGRYDPLKDHSNLLKALFLIKEKKINFKCLLVGDFLSQENKYLIDEIASFDLLEHVLLLEQRSDIPAIMNALDIHVLSSYSEAFPNVLAEAMACGTPCVTTDVGDAALIVGKTGWVAPSRNAQALAEEIIKALEENKNIEKWRKRQLAARQRIVENFSIEKMINSYHAVWSL